MKFKALRYRKYLLALLVAILVTAWFFFVKTKPQSLEYVNVQKQDLRTEVSTSGILTGKYPLNLRFKGVGRLTAMNVKAGDEVFQGQILAGLNVADLRVNLQQAQNTLRDKQATFEKVIDDIHLSQYGNGGFSNVGTENETMLQRQTRTTAEVARDNAVDSVKLAQRAFEDSLVISPISGIVTQSDFIPGQIVSSADVIARVVDFGEILFEADVDESDIGDVKTGQRAEVTLNAYGDKKFGGEVFEIIPRTKTISSGATVVTVKIRLDDQSILKIDGLNGQVNIITSQKSGILTLPIEAISGEDTVMVKNGENFKSVQIKLGERNETDVEVLEGLKEGDQVIKNPNSLPQNTNNFNPLSRIFRGLKR